MDLYWAYSLISLIVVEQLLFATHWVVDKDKILALKEHIFSCTDKINTQVNQVVLSVVMVVNSVVRYRVIWVR